MKSAHNLFHWRLLVVIVLVLGSTLTGGAPVFAATSSTTSTVTSSNAAPSVGQQILPKGLDASPAVDYTLTAGNDGHGTVTLNPTGGTYASGTTVTLTPAPAQGYSFTSWSGTNAGDIVNTLGVYTIVMNGNKSVQANFGAISGNVASAATPNNATPSVGGQIVVTININMSGVTPSTTALGSFSGSLVWNTAVLQYVSRTALAEGFSGNINTSGSGTGQITFNGANPDGATGNITVFTVTFNVVAAGTSPLDLAYSAMSAASSFTPLVPFLTVTDGTVTAGGAANHTVTFNNNLGTGTMSPQVANVPTALTANTFTRSGYTFSGWNTLANGTGTAYADGAIYSFSADVTLYAQWTALPNHTVTFNSNLGTGTMSPQVANVPTALTANTFTRSGYTFSGWNTAANGSGTAYTNSATYSFAADITLYAQWTALPNHTVTFNNNLGTGTMSPQVANVPTALTANTFTRSGYTFSGWNTLANGTGTAYADGAIYSFSADVTLYAQWTALPNHTVTFNSNLGTGTMSPQVANVPTALTANTFTRAGYTFSGWNTAANGSGTAYANGVTYSFAADLTLYAQWSTQPNHTVTFNNNLGTGTMSPQVANVPTALTANTFTRSGYTFSGWNTAANGTGTAYADGAIYSFSADVTLYAQWTALPNHTVTFNSNLGTGTMSPQVANVPTALTANTFTRSGYTFSGWNTAANGSGTAYANSATYSFAADITLYAQWTALPNHTVTFNNNLGTGTMSPQVANVPTALTANTFTRSGYTFSGWNTLANGTGTAYADGAIYSFSADVTLYAQWTALPNHTVTFMANGGSGTMSPQVANVPTALTANTFTRSGYTFSGWNTAANGSGTAYANGVTYSFAADLTLYAQWSTGSNYTLTAGNDGHGTVTLNPTGGTYASGTTVTLTPAPAQGYSFTSWSGTNAGDIVNTLGVYTIVMNGNKSVQANFGAISGNVASAATPNNATPSVGGQIVVTININMSGVTPSTTALGNFSGSLAWNTAVLQYVSHTALPTGFSGNINTSGSGTGQIAFNGANTDGATGNITVFTVTFNVVAAGTSPLDLAYSAMSAAYSFTPLMPFLTVTDGTVTAGGGANHTVTFMANGGSGTMSPQVANVPTALTANTFTRSGYTFSGWNTAANGSGTAYANGVTYSFAADLTLYAQWSTGSNYTLTAGNDGHGTVTLNPTGGTYASGTTVTLTPAPAQGYSFTSWSGTNAGDIVNTLGVYTIVMNGNKSVQANFGAISGNVASAATPNNATPSVGGQIVVTININMSGVTPSTTALGNFSGSLAWNTAVLQYVSHTALPTGFSGNINTSGSGTGQIAFNGANTDGATGNITVFTVTFNVVAAGTSPLDLAYSAMSAAYSFTPLMPFLTVTDGTVTAGGGANHTVTFMANGGSGTMSPQVANVPTALKANTFTRTGYTFSGWNTLANGTGTAYANSATYSFAADLTLYAQWTALVNHTVTFNSNGGTGTMSNQTANVPTALTANTFTRTGYTFSGWNTLANGTGTAYANSATYSFAADITLYAQWTALVNHTVTFNSNGGTGTMSPQIANVPTALTANTFTRTGYTFNGWNTLANGTGTAYANSATYSFAADLTLYAQWKVQPNYNLTTAVGSGGGGTIDPAAGVHAYAAGTVVAVTATPDFGYKLSSWSGDCSGTGDCSVTMNADKTVTANFTPINYTLIVAVSPSGGGTTDPAVGAHTYAFGTVVSVTATPATGYVFSSWSGACTGSGACSVTMNFNTTVTANFTPINYNLTTAVSPSGGGTINPAAGVHAYAYGTVVNVTATPATGYAFSSWSGACTGSGACSVTMDAAKSVTANFTVINYNLTTAVSPGGAGTINPAAGVHAYAYGTVVVVTATPAAGYTFSSWSGACTGSGACSVTMDAAKTVTANFTGLSYDLTVAVSPSGGGTTNPAVGVHPYAYGVVVNVTATPAAGYTFTSWSGACTGSGACSVTMDAAKTVTANFTVINYNLTTAVSPSGGGTVNPAAGVHAYAYGTVVAVTATPATGYVFSSWSGACTGSGACSVTIDADKTVTANFTAIKRYLQFLPLISRD